MGNSFGFLRAESPDGFQFTVVNACKAENIDLNQTCSLTFGSNHDLVAIGNVTRGTMEPQPGIAGIGIWFAMILFFGVVAIALVFVIVEILSRTTAPNSNVIAFFKDTPVNDPEKPGKRKRHIFRAAGRTFVLGVSDTQTIFVGAFLLSFAGQSKCQLTSYHFTVAVSQMMIALSVITFSVALIRTYWRSPLAAAFRLILSLGAFIGVGLTIFRKANYAPDWPPPDTRKDSAILLPVACLLESRLRSLAEAQAKKAQIELGFGNAATWPVERFLFIALVTAFLTAHLSIPIRFAESRDYAPARWTRFRGWFTVAYWAYMLGPPTFTCVWCWVRVYRAREWVKNSGWIGDPNTEMIIWNSGQLIAMGVMIILVMNMLTETVTRDDKEAEKQKQRGDFQRLSSGGEEFQRLSSGGDGEWRPGSYPMVNMGHDQRTDYHGYR